MVCRGHGESPGLGGAVRSVTGTCTPLPAEGEDCQQATFGPGTDCAPGLVCADGTCVTRQDNGGSCTADEGCYSDHCDGDVCAAPVCG